MSDRPDDIPRLVLEDVAPIALELAGKPDLPALVARFLETVRTWAAPSGVAAAVRDKDAECGWRLLPAVTAGSMPLGFERSLQTLVEGTPEVLARPTIVRPKDDVPGVKPRDNCIVPWSFEGESGLLLLRGIPRPYAPNLGEALALLATPLWPRLLGGPARRVTSLLEELRRVSQRLETEGARQLERLAAAQPAEVKATQAPDDGRVAALEEESRTAREQRDRALRAQQEAEERAAGLKAAAELNRTERDEARTELQRTQASLAAAVAERDAAREERERLASGHGSLESERESARAENERLQAQIAGLSATVAELQGDSDRIQALAAERDSALGQTEELRRTSEAALAKARASEETLATVQRELAASRALGDPRELTERLARLETALETMRAERDRARSEIEVLSARLASSQTAAGANEELQRAAQAAEARARTAEQALAAAQNEATTARAVSERYQVTAKESADRWDGALSAVRQALAALRRAAFVPPGLRLSMEDAAAHVDTKEKRVEPWIRIALLDRDPVGLEGLSAELEAAGLEIKIANYPEELGLLLRTPHSRDLAAIVCDVMAFRADQNVAGLFRSWDKDRPGLAYYLSFNPDNPSETDRARRVPQSLTAGHLSRPLAKARVVEAFEVLAKKRVASS